MNKLLLTRFSSIGDVVLTTPVIRAIQQQIPDAEVHYITTKFHAQVLRNNPYIDKLWTVEKHPSEIIGDLQKEDFRAMIDLHKNRKSFYLKRHLKTTWLGFSKINTRKWIAVNLKIRRVLPPKHLVHRYFEALHLIGAKYDGQGLDYFLDASDTVDLPSGEFIAVAMGAKYQTKTIPLKKLEEMVKSIDKTFLLLGDKNDVLRADALVAASGGKAVSLAGKLSIGQSAYVISKASLLVSGDTGLMHIGAALKKPVVSLWGSTIPEFGMYPFYPDGKEQLSFTVQRAMGCRPCSKLGFQACPKVHYKCMNKLDIVGDVHTAIVRIAMCDDATLG